MVRILFVFSIILGSSAFGSEIDFYENPDEFLNELEDRYDLEPEIEDYQRKLDLEQQIGVYEKEIAEAVEGTVLRHILKGNLQTLKEQRGDSHIKFYKSADTEEEEHDSDEISRTKKTYLNESSDQFISKDQFIAKCTLAHFKILASEWIGENSSSYPERVGKKPKRLFSNMWEEINSKLQKLSNESSLETALAHVNTLDENIGSNFSKIIELTLEVPIED